MVALLRLARSKGFRIVVLSWFCDLFAVGTIGAMLPYYVGYVLLDPQVAITPVAGFVLLSSTANQIGVLRCGGETLAMTLALSISLPSSPLPSHYLNKLPNLAPPTSREATWTTLMKERG